MLKWFMALVLFALVVLLLGTVLVVLPIGLGTLPGTSSAGNENVVSWAMAMAGHLHCQNPTSPTSGPDCQDARLPVPVDTWYDAGFPAPVLAWADQHCPGCAAWQNGNFQCVALVIGAYALAGDPLPVTTQNADQYWTYFAHQSGWLEIPVGSLPLPGDVMVWAGGPVGHLSIVTAVDPMLHVITFAQADGQMPLQTLPLRADLTVNTHNGYWDQFSVVGYLRPAQMLSLTAGKAAS